MEAPIQPRQKRPHCLRLSDGEPPGTSCGRAHQVKGRRMAAPLPPSSRAARTSDGRLQQQRGEGGTGRGRWWWVAEGSARVTQRGRDMFVLMRGNKIDI
jgi:hypothetical protein